MTAPRCRGLRAAPALLRSLLASAGALVVVLAGLAGPAAGTAHAAGGYRYWSFWQQEHTGGGGAHWSYATQGPSVLRPEDGAVLGFRFALSPDSKDAARPRGDAGFAAVCGRTEEKPGTKRVALTLDFGTRADAPEGATPPGPRTACARVAEDATAGDALAAVAKPLRYNSAALLCAIDGYPERGCGEQVSGSDDRPADDGAGKAGAAKDDGDGGPPTGVGIGAGVAVVAALAAAATWQARRRR